MLEPTMMPTVRLEIQGVRHAIMHQFLSYQDELAVAVDAAIKKAIDNYDLEREVQKVIHQLLTDSIQKSVPAIAKALRENLNG